MLWSECVSFSGFCRIKLCGYVPFIFSFKPTVCCWRQVFFFNFLWRSQDDRRRIGTPTARARVWSHLICWHLAFPILALPIFPFDLYVWQVPMEFGLDKRAQTLQGLAFPLQEEAKRALQQLKQKRINYIQLVSRHRKTQLHTWTHIP